MSRVKSSFIIKCFACGKSECHGYGDETEVDFHKEDMMARGWFRRAFVLSSWDKGPWFCSKDCGYYSPIALRAELESQDD